MDVFYLSDVTNSEILFFARIIEPEVGHFVYTGSETADFLSNRKLATSSGELEKN